MLTRFACALLANLLLTAAANAQARTDALGDPLPTGAIARLGTLRFKHPQGANLGNANLPSPTRLTAIKFSPDGSKIASAAFLAGNVCVWDARTGKQLPGPWTSSVIYCERTFAFSPDGNLLAVFGNEWQDYTRDKHVMVWDLAAGKVLQHFPTSKWVQSVTFAENKTVVTTEGHVVRWWDLTTGKEKRAWKPFGDVPRPDNDEEDNKPPRTSYYLNLSPGARYLAAQVWLRYRQGRALRNHEVVFDLAGGKELWRTPLAPGLVGMTFSMDGERLGFLRDDRVDVHAAATGKLLAGHVLDPRLGRDKIIGVDLANDGTVALSGPHSQVFLSAPAAGKWRDFGGRPAALQDNWMRRLAFSPDGKTLVVGGNAHLQVYDVATLKEIHTFDGHRDWVEYLAFSADGKRLLTGSGQDDLYPRELMTWEVGTWKQLSISPGRPPRWPNLGIASPEHTVYVGKKGDDRLNLYDYANGKQIGRLDVPAGQDPKERGFFAPGGKFYVLFTKDADRDDIGHVYEVPSGKRLCKLPVFFLSPIAGMRPISFSADGQLVAVHSMTSAIYVIETATGKVHLQLGEKPGDRNVDFANLTFSPDGKYLATWNDWDDAVKVWDLKTGKEWMRILDKKKPGAVHLAFSPNGRMLAVGATTIQVYELATQKLRWEFAGHGVEVRALAFSPDSRLLASGSIDTTVLIWEVGGR